MGLQKNIWLRLLFALVVAILLQWSFAKLAAGFAGLALNESGEAVDLKDHLLLLGSASGLALLFTSLLFCVIADKIPFASMGFAWNGQEKNALIGFCVSIFILSVAAWIFSITGLVTFSATTVSPADVMLAFAVMGLVALGEEVFFRGYLQRNLAKLVNPHGAWLITAFIFMLLHMGNPAQNALAMPGIFAGGLMLGVNYMFTKNLWFGISLHWAWNFLQGSILGFPVSGNKLTSLLSQSQQGAAWLTGGSFGIEASLVVIGFELIMVLVLYKSFKERPVK
jgi:membrane protease YdiL (CAAX protease family)